MRLACGPDGNLNVLSQSGEEVHQAFYRKRSRAVAHHPRDVGLFAPEDLSGFGLRDAALFDEAVDWSVSRAFSSSCSGWGKPRSAKTFPLLFSMRRCFATVFLKPLGFFVFLITSVLPLPMQPFGFAWGYSRNGERGR